MPAACVLLLAVAFGAWVRVATALDDPNFDAHDPAGMLKSDPGLLYYFVERIVESGGGAPADFRADPRVEHPLLTDVPALFPVGLEFAVAWCRPLFGEGVPLHVVSLYVMAVCASLAVVGVFGIVLEVAGFGWACWAAALCVLLPANYRTIGFLLVAEDFSVPFLLLHLWLVVRAVRVRTAGAVLLAALPLAVALSTWHALGFFFAIEVACVFAWFLASGENPLADRRAPLLLGVLVAAGLAVPVLRHTLFAGSPAMLLLYGLTAAALWSRRPGATRRGALAAAIATPLVGLAAAVSVSRLSGAGLGEYGHVFGLVWHKLMHLGVRPEDPRELPFDVRLLWQGPFETLELSRGLALLGVATPFLAFAVYELARPGRARTIPRGALLVTALAAASLPAAWLIERTIVLTGLVAPAVAAFLLARAPARRLAAALAAGALLLQALLFAGFVRGHRIGWYVPAQQAEIRELVRHIPELVPESEAIAADFVNSTAILAHTRRPIVLQPKYEMRRSRERAENFLRAFFEGTPEDLRRLLVEKYRCRHVLIDRAVLGAGSRYAAGIPLGVELHPGSAAAVLTSQDGRVLESVPGYRLLYRSPASLVQSNGAPSDFFRLYELAP